MSLREKYTLAYRLIRYYGDFETFHSMCRSYDISREIRKLAYMSYINS